MIDGNVRFDDASLDHAAGETQGHLAILRLGEGAAVDRSRPDSGDRIDRRFSGDLLLDGALLDLFPGGDLLLVLLESFLVLLPRLDVLSTLPQQALHPAHQRFWVATHLEDGRHIAQHAVGTSLPHSLDRSAGGGTPGDAMGSQENGGDTTAGDHRLLDVRDSQGVGQTIGSPDTRLVATESEMAVGIDEPRRHEPISAGVDHSRPRRVRNAVADRGDPAIFDENLTVGDPFVGSDPDGPSADNGR